LYPEPFEALSAIRDPQSEIANGSRRSPLTPCPSAATRFPQKTMAEIIPSPVDSLRSLAQRIVLVLLALYLAGPSANAQPVEPTFSQIVVFGDSFSDTGNVRDRTETVSGGSVNYPAKPSTTAMAGLPTVAIPSHRRF